jgi:NHL repeat
MLRILPIVALLLILTGVPASATAEVPPPFWTKCTTGSAAGQCVIPRGIVSDPDSGNVYVADQDNNRIDEFTAWGAFMRAWGWDVVASGPGDDTTAPEDQFEVCVPADGDVCQAGAAGGGSGQLTSPQGLALDSSGDLYVTEGNFSNRRVQKFDPSAGPSEEEVRFVWMAGGKVDKTKVEEVGSTEAEQNLCTAASGDVCQAATEGTGNGQFGEARLGSQIGIGTGDKVYVGDHERIQVFEASGVYLKSLPVPGEFVQSLAVDPTGDLYISYYNEGEFNIALAKPNVHKLSSAGASICTIEVKNPTAIATDPTGNVYVVNGSTFGLGKSGRPNEVRQFSSACIDKNEPFDFGGVPDFAGQSTGIATSTACGVDGVSVYVSNGEEKNSFVKAYGQHPDPGLCPPPKVAPSIDAQFATQVGSEDAIVHAQINSHFWLDTTYYVQYGTAACIAGGWEGECVKAQPTPPGATLKDGGVDEDVTVGAVLTELQPNTAYRYRFVSQGSGSEGEPVRGVGGTVGIDGEDSTFTTFPSLSEPKLDCPNQAFRVAAASHLPDCRAYEMVSPIDKNNGDISVFSNLTSGDPSGLEQSSVDGEQFTYSAAVSFGDAPSAPYTSQYLASRKAGAGWSTHAISPPRDAKSISTNIARFDREYNAFSLDLCSGWLVHDTDPPLAAGAVAGFQNLYRRDNCGENTGSFEAITTVEPPNGNAGFYRPELQGLSSDGSRAFFVAYDKLTDDAADISGSANPQLYESSGGILHYVCVLPNGIPLGQPCSAGAPIHLPNDRNNTVARAVSEDGSRVFWTAVTVGGTGPLYVRENPSQEQSMLEGGDCTEPDKACTIAISKSANTYFWTASLDGSKVIYTIGEKLFEFDVEAAETTAIADGVVGVAGASDDASHLYFASTKVLSGEEENSERDKAQEGKPNLYLDRAGEAGGEGTLTFIATLSSADVAPQSPLASVSANPTRRAARVSPDGGNFAFTSMAHPTGYDNTDAHSANADSEVFLFDASTDELACISCNPSGARPAGQNYEVLQGYPTGFWAAAQIPGWESQLYAPRALSDDGTRLLFESTDALVPSDVNGKQDVYEWERAGGEGQCDEVGAELYVAAAGGCISLISSGESATNSDLADASPSGRDVFFKTASSLLPQDPGLVDVYDARESGGLPQPPQAPAGCEGETCQGPSSAPDDATPASSSFHGASNSTKSGPPRCRRGKVRREGRCVGKHRNHHRANHKRRAGQ